MDASETHSQETTVESVAPTEPVVAKQKVPRTPAQLASLENARKKAMEVRGRQADLRRKEKEIARAQQDRDTQERTAKIQRDYDALHETEEVEEEEEEVAAPVKKRKPRRKIIVHEVSSAEEDEEDEVEVILPKERKRGPTPEELAYQHVHSKMFSYE